MMNGYRFHKLGKVLWQRLWPSRPLIMSGFFDENKRFSMRKPLIMSGFDLFRSPSVSAPELALFGKIRSHRLPFEHILLI